MTEELWITLTTLFCEEDVWFIYLVLDQVEWTDPRFYHQN